MTGRRQEIGRWGETLAAKYLSDKGYSILARNLRTPYGEIDLIANNGGTTIFVEVKTRTTASYGYPENAITLRKQAHMVSAAEHYLQEHPELANEWQIDVISIEGSPGRPPLITHFENALS